MQALQNILYISSFKTLRLSFYLAIVSSITIVITLYPCYADEDAEIEVIARQLVIHKMVEDSLRGLMSCSSPDDTLNAEVKKGTLVIEDQQSDHTVIAYSMALVDIKKADSAQSKLVIQCKFAGCVGLSVTSTDKGGVKVMSNQTFRNSILLKSCDPDYGQDIASSINSLTSNEFNNLRDITASAIPRTLRH